MRLSRRSILFALAGALFPRAGRATETAAALAEAKKRIADAATKKKKSFPLASAAIKVKKADRVLELYDGDTLVKSYTVSLGLNPTGPKREQGDYKTPEGTYYVCSKNDTSQFHLFLGLSYPNGADAKAGLEAKKIDAKTAEQIEAAEKARTTPPWQTALGGAVGIHGGGTGNDWTWGCVALSDEDVNELWEACPAGTPVTISA
jgi:murein L,D-transpeptidase YafK